MSEITEKEREARLKEFREARRKEARQDARAYNWFPNISTEPEAYWAAFWDEVGKMPREDILDFADMQSDGKLFIQLRRNDDKAGYYCRPTEKLLERMKGRSIYGDRNADEMHRDFYLKVIFVEDQCRLFASYQQIIGSKLVAFLDPESVKAFIKKYGNDLCQDNDSTG